MRDAHENDLADAGLELTLKTRKKEARSIQSIARGEMVERTLGLEL